MTNVITFWNGLIDQIKNTNRSPDEYDDDEEADYNFTSAPQAVKCCTDRGENKIFIF